MPIILMSYGFILHLLRNRSQSLKVLILVLIFCLVVGVTSVLSSYSQSPNQQTPTLKEEAISEEQKILIELTNGYIITIGSKGLITKKDSKGHIIKDISYEEVKELSNVLAELEELGQIQYSREYEIVKDKYGRTIRKSENGFVTTYEYPKYPYIPIPTSTKTVKEKKNREKQEKK